MLLMPGQLARGVALSDEQRGRASELFQKCRAALASGEDQRAREAVDTLVTELPAAASVALAPLESEARTLVRAYRQAAELALARQSAADRLRDPQVKEARQLLASIRGMADEGAMKEKLQADGLPALARLQTQLLPDTASQLAADPAVEKRRQAAAVRLDLIDKLRAAASLPADHALREEMAAASAGSAGLEQIVKPDDRKILKQNEKILASVPAEEAAGIRDANRLRVLCGLSVLEADPKLCEAARGHSKDMVEKGFFAHESPVPGKATPWARAQAAGTTASAENIAAGQETPEKANESWFLSPGHHKNFFGDHKRIGLGRHEQHWTQLFGR